MYYMPREILRCDPFQASLSMVHTLVQIRTIFSFVLIISNYFQFGFHKFELFSLWNYLIRTIFTSAKTYIRTIFCSFVRTIFIRRNFILPTRSMTSEGFMPYLWKIFFRISKTAHISNLCNTKSFFF